MRRKLGTVPQETALHEELSAWTNLAFHAGSLWLPRREKKQRLEAMLDLVQLGATAVGARVKDVFGWHETAARSGARVLDYPELIWMNRPSASMCSRAGLCGITFHPLHTQGKTILLTTQLPGRSLGLV